jgi:hypothetical protein
MGTDTDPAPEDLPAPAPSSVSPDVVRSYRWQLTPGEDLIDTGTWAGSVPHVNGIAPRVRVGRTRWFNLLWLLPIGFGLLIVAVAVAQGLRGEPPSSSSSSATPGPSSPRAPRRRQASPSGRDGSTSSTCSS